MLAGGREPEGALLPIAAYADYVRFGVMPVDVWSLPAETADELRYVHAVFSEARAAAKQKEDARQARRPAGR